MGKILNYKKIHRPSPKRQKLFIYISSIKETSLFISLSKCISGSMTVEAAIILPLFLMVFINLGSAIEMIRLHGNLQVALWNVGNNMCLYGHVSVSLDGNLADGSESGVEVLNEMIDFALSYGYIKQEIINSVGERYLEESPLKKGKAGLQFWESEIVPSISEDDKIKIVLTYEVGPWMEIPYVKGFRMANCYYGRLWTGYDVSKGNEGEQSSEQDVVYVTETGEVYHESLECTHLKLKIQEVTIESLKYVRNEQGRRYTICSLCKNEGLSGNIYIAAEGTAYHYIRECSGLKRTIRTINRSDALGYRPCSRCAAK